MAQAKKYKTLLSKTAEETCKEELAFKVKETELQLQADILATQKNLEVAKRNLVSAKGAFDFDSQKILDAQADVEAVTEAITRLEELQKELF